MSADENETPMDWEGAEEDEDEEEEDEDEEEEDEDEEEEDEGEEEDDEGEEEEDEGEEEEEQPTERSGHVAVMDGRRFDQRMFLWGGFKNAPVWDESDLYLPRDEIWIFYMTIHTWIKEKTSGEIPPPMAGSCAAYLKRTIYLFGGHHAHGNSNELYTLNLTSNKHHVLEWKRRECKGVPPSKKDKLGVWVYKNRLIFFGGYGYFKEDTIGNFEFEKTSFGNAGPAQGWNNHVHVLDPNTFTWQQPITTGKSPSPRAAHACAAAGNRGYVFGGRYQESSLNDLYHLHFDTWEWTQVTPQGECPIERSWHSLTKISSDCLFLFGGFTTDKQPLSDTWLFSIRKNQWIRYENSFPDKARLWHTACASKEGEVIVFGGCTNNELAHHTAAHSNEMLVFNVQPKSLRMLCESALFGSSELWSDWLVGQPKHLHSVHEWFARININGF